jgi:predicted MPP superfamily phosphohydrolase
MPPSRAAVSLAGIGAALLGGAVLAYARYVEPKWAEVVRLELTLPRLAPQFDGYRIVHISDIHLDEHMGPGRLEKFVGMVNAQDPDVVAITGDFVQYTAERFAPMLTATLRELRPRDAAVGVLGNHDHESGAGAVRRALREAGVLDLSNAVHTLRRDGAELHVAGVDSVWEDEHRLDVVLGALPPEGAAVLLTHEPDFADASSATGRFDLQLSGHSHGGQVRLPLIGPPRLTWLAEKYYTGRYQVGGMILYATRGLGMLPPRVRFLCRPEITAITLKAPPALPAAASRTGSPGSLTHARLSGR